MYLKISNFYLPTPHFNKPHGPDITQIRCIRIIQMSTLQWHNEFSQDTSEEMLITSVTGIFNSQQIP